MIEGAGAHDVDSVRLVVLVAEQILADFADAIGAERPERGGFGDRDLRRMDHPVFLARAGNEHPGSRSALHRLEDMELAHHVGRDRVLGGGPGAGHEGLSGEVEDPIGANVLYGSAHRPGVEHVRLDQVQAGDMFDVLPGAATTVRPPHFHPAIQAVLGKMAAGEARYPGDQYPHGTLTPCERTAWTGRRAEAKTVYQPSVRYSRSMAIRHRLSKGRRSRKRLKR